MKVISMDAVKVIRVKRDLNEAEMLQALRARGINLVENHLFDEDLSAALRNHIYLTHFPELVEQPARELDRFYSRYYWFLLFAEKRKSKLDRTPDWTSRSSSCSRGPTTSVWVSIGTLSRNSVKR